MTDAVADLLQSPPKLHFWRGGWKVGGFGEAQLKPLRQAVESLGPNPHIIETGAGLSTLLFLTLGASVTSFFTKADLRDRIASAIEERGLKFPWTPVVGWRYYT